MRLSKCLLVVASLAVSAVANLPGGPNEEVVRLWNQPRPEPTGWMYAGEGVGALAVGAIVGAGPKTRDTSRIHEQCQGAE